MTRELKIVQFISLFLLMLVTGLFWGTWFTLTRSLENFDLAEFNHIGNVVVANLEIAMRFIMPACLVFMSLSGWFYPDKKSVGFYFWMASMGLIVVTALVTLLSLDFSNNPESNQMALLVAANEFSDWREVQIQWEYFHAFRTFASMASFGCLALSVIWLLPQKIEQRLRARLIHQMRI